VIYAAALSKTPTSNEKPESVMMMGLPCGAMMSIDAAMIWMAVGETVTFTRVLLLLSSDSVLTPTYSKESLPEYRLFGMQGHVLASYNGSEKNK
jgi:hypothetical protein